MSRTTFRRETGRAPRLILLVLVLAGSSASCTIRDARLPADCVKAHDEFHGDTDPGGTRAGDVYTICDEYRGPPK